LLIDKKMKLLQSLLTALALLASTSAFAQETVKTESFDDFVARINAECPINSGGNWSIESFATASDTAMVELQVPASLVPFMSLLTEKSDNAKRLWVRELDGFGETWHAFVAKLVEADRPLKLTFKPQGRGEDDAASIILMPADFKKK
jgi:hypothetical protein